MKTYHMVIIYGYNRHVYSLRGYFMLHSYTVIRKSGNPEVFFSNYIYDMTHFACVPIFCITEMNDVLDEYIIFFVHEGDSLS